MYVDSRMTDRETRGRKNAYVHSPQSSAGESDKSAVKRNAIRFLTYFSNAWNKHAAPFDLEIDFSESDVKNLISFPEFKEFSRDCMAMGFEKAIKAPYKYGALPEDKIPETIKLLVELRDKHGHISFSAFEQWGKTSIMIVTQLIGNVMFQNLGRPEHILIVNTMESGVAAQTVEDYEQIRRFMHCFHLKLADSDITVHNANPDHVLSCMKRNGFSTRNTGNQHVEDYIETILEDRNGADFVPVLLTDECDKGPGINSLSDRLEARFKNKGLHVREVWITATSSSHHNSDVFNAERGGARISVSNIAPRKNGFCHLIQGNQYLVSPTSSLGLTNFDINDHYQSRVNDVLKAVGKIISGDFDVPANKWRGGFKTGTAFNGAKGIVIRYGKTEYAKFLSDKLRRKFPGVKVIEYFGQYIIKGKSVKDSIKKIRENNPDQPYIILVSGSMRRGDRLPDDCVVALELTFKISTDTAFRQGSAARIGGWGKMIDGKQCPILFIGDDMAESVYEAREHYARTGKDDYRLGSVDPYTASIDGEIKTKKIVQISISLDDHPEWKAHIKKMFSPTMRWTQPTQPAGTGPKRCPTKTKTGKQRVSMVSVNGSCGINTDIGDVTAKFGGKMPSNISYYLDPSKKRGKRLSAEFYAIFNGKAAMKAIEKAVGKQYTPAPEFLLPGEKSADGHYLNTKTPGKPTFVRVTHGNAQRSGHGDDTTGRASTQLGEKESSEQRSFSIMWNRLGDGNYDPSFVTVNVKTPTRQNFTPGSLVPNQRHRLRNKQSAEQNEQVDLSKAAKSRRRK